jgi:hypothetical protein
MTQPNKPLVSQRARDYAADLHLRTEAGDGPYSPFDLACASAIRSGANDHWDGPQAFARFEAETLSLSSETSWLIERRVTPPQWACSQDAGVGTFYSDVQRAYRWPTKEAAQNALGRALMTPEQRSEYFVSEHIWIDGPAAATPTPASVIEKCGDALEAFARLERSITADVSTAHSLRGEGASSEMRSDDRDMRADLRHAFGLLHIALASKEGQHHGQG